MVNTKTQKVVKCKIVKAGEISKLTSLVATINNLECKIFVYDGQKQDISDFEIFVVSGESMAQNGIHTGNGILVKKLYNEQKFKLTGHPLLVFEIDTERKKYRTPGVALSDDIEYKLRKFVAYFRCDIDFDVELDAIAEQNQDILLRENRDKILSKYEGAIKYYKGIDVLLMSSTWHDGKIGYSFHPAKYLVGKVEYIIPKDAYKI